MIIRKDKGMGPGNIDWDLLNVKVSQVQRAHVRGFAEQDSDNRIRRVSVLGDSGNLGQFYLIYYAILFDNDKEVRIAALKRLHQFVDHPDFNKLISMINELNCREELEPDFSQVLQDISYSGGEFGIKKP